MAQEVTAFATKLDDLDLVPRTHMVGGDKFCNLFSDLHVQTVVSTHPINKCKTKVSKAPSLQFAKITCTVAT